MGYNLFLFEFPTKYMGVTCTVRRVVVEANKTPYEMGSSVAGCCSDSHRKGWTWIRAMGLPMHLWTEKIFKAIVDQCGGWVETEERRKLL